MDVPAVCMNSLIHISLPFMGYVQVAQQQYHPSGKVTITNVFFHIAMQKLDWNMSTKLLENISHF